MTRETRTTRKREAGASTDARLASIVIAVAVCGWWVGSWIGGRLGLPVRYAFLLDLACLAALVFALVLLLRVWRARRNMEK